MLLKLLSTCILFCSVLPLVYPHGYLTSPSDRYAAFLAGFSNVPKYQNYKGRNCGGRSYQWYTVGGKCGVCGDKHNSAADKEAQTKSYIVGYCYNPGDHMRVVVTITAHHKGYFEFRLCKRDKVEERLTHDCLNQHLLKLTDDKGQRFKTRYSIDVVKSVYNIEVYLPDQLTCDRCVLQWKWHGGNNWGNIQEEFYGCADISIQNDCSKCSIKHPQCRRGKVYNTHPKTTTSTAPPTTSTKYKNCKAKGKYTGLALADNCCKKNCAKGKCPQFCDCEKEPVFDCKV